MRPLANLRLVRDAATRSRFETTLSPFLKLRNPRPESVQFVTNFARKTGDLQVLSKPDIHLLALTYDLEVERNGGDVRYPGLVAPVCLSNKAVVVAVEAGAEPEKREWEAPGESRGWSR